MAKPRTVRIGCGAGTSDDPFLCEHLTPERVMPEVDLPGETLPA